ncbi:glutathione peroxidase [Polynucleobacter sp. MG-5-Ahmo-C2]|uniref:glutathione peroxidase n=1 Tax=Polynucleobacter sp. MG-5-Ahmo-C2 TaxID=2081051 RepID=UPI001BFE8CE3|nr:glutathione peroxidase [Polynucleobacter sp. MG-5-Ahmo-C2]QWD98419.1 glutathione peroxidase [Polynucleobacter sp. MG-5-Ahmo-C2]
MHRESSYLPRTVFTWVFILTALLLGAQVVNAAPSCSPLLSQTFPRLQDETPQNLCQFQGKVILVVNTASFCGFTGQYEGLEKIYAKYKDQGFVVLGFPSNDFGQQEPGSNKEIADFCKNTYDVKFPMFAKSSVSGSNPNPLFKMLIAKTGTTPKWNFYKYLIDRNGNFVDSYGSMTKPTSSTITTEIEKLLAEKPQ